MRTRESLDSLYMEAKTLMRVLSGALGKFLSGAAFREGQRFACSYCLIEFCCLFLRDENLQVLVQGKY